MWAHGVQAQPASNNVSIMVKRLASAANRNWEGRRLDAQRSVLSENMVDIGIGELLRTGHFLTGIQVPHTKQSEKLQRLLFSELDLIFFFISLPRKPQVLESACSCHT